MSGKKKFITSSLFIRFLYHFVGIYLWTLRVTVENERPWRDHLEKGGRVLLCGWHQQFFSFIRYFRNYRRYNPSLMISRSKDGEIVARVAELTGWQTVRGSSSRGGKEALYGMIERLRTNRFAAHVVDGPRGPFGVLKRGVIRMAMDADAVVVPVYAVSENAWYFNSWDRFQLPKPFSRVIIRFGDMVEIGKAGDTAGFEEQRRNLENTMLGALVRR